MGYKLYDLGKIAKADFSEINVAIINKDKVILSDQDAVHTIHTKGDHPLAPMGCKLTVEDILATEPVGEIEHVGKWVRSFGSRLENNYSLLLKSIKKIGLKPKDFPR